MTKLTKNNIRFLSAYKAIILEKEEIIKNEKNAIDNFNFMFANLSKEDLSIIEKEGSKVYSNAIQEQEKQLQLQQNSQGMKNQLDNKKN